jgi:hypothetical protein
MQNFGYNLNAENPLTQYLRQYIPAQEPAKQTDAVTSSATTAYEINTQSELEYIVPDTSGRKQIVDCPSENRIYVGRYSHLRRTMDWKAYAEEKDVIQASSTDTGKDISKIAEALVAVADKLEAMHAEIQELKLREPVEASPPESNRLPNGQFKKKGA